jgi:hypothetical protein
MSKFERIYAHALINFAPLELRVKLLMLRSLGYWPNIDNPKTFNEKIAYRKLRQRDNRYRVLADKWTVRDYVKSKIGGDYLRKVFSVICSISELNFERLPERFVAKPAHMSGEVYFVPSKVKVNREQFIRILRNWLNKKYRDGIKQGEYWYEEMSPKVMFEELLLDGKYSIPLDFKFFVFHGKVHAIQVDFDRFINHCINFYTREWRQIPMRKGNYPNKPVNPHDVRPNKLEEMITAAETLGEDFDFVRVDFHYLFNIDRIVFSEMTFAPGSGCSPFTPNYYDLKFGKLWRLN